MTIAVKIILIEDAGEQNTPRVDLSYISASTRAPIEHPIDFLVPGRREITVHVTERRDVRISFGCGRIGSPLQGTQP